MVKLGEWYQSHPSTGTSDSFLCLPWHPPHPQPDLPLMLKYAGGFHSWAPNQNYSLLPIDITFLMPISSWYELKTIDDILTFLSCTSIFVFLTVLIHQDYYSNFPLQQFHEVIEPDPFHMQSYFSHITCDQGSLAVYTSFWYPSQHVGYNEWPYWELKNLKYP